MQSVSVATGPPPPASASSSPRTRSRAACGRVFAYTRDGPAARRSLIGVKAGRPSGVEYKSTSGAVAAQRRTGGMPTAAPCSVCGRPAAAVVPGGLRAGETMICPRCVEVADDHTATDTATISAGDLAELAELTSEEEYAAALSADVEWQLLADGTLARGTGSTGRGGRAWGRP